MPAPQIIPLPPNFELSDGYRIVVTAVDATTNATVSGVVVSAVSIDVDPGDVVEETVKLPDYETAFSYGLEV